MKAIAKSV